MVKKIINLGDISSYYSWIRAINRKHGLTNKKIDIKSNHLFQETCSTVLNKKIRLSKEIKLKRLFLAGKEFYLQHLMCRLNFILNSKISKLSEEHNIADQSQREEFTHHLTATIRTALNGLFGALGFFEVGILEREEIPSHMQQILFIKKLKEIFPSTQTDHIGPFQSLFQETINGQIAGFQKQWNDRAELMMESENIEQIVSEYTNEFLEEWNMLMKKIHSSIPSFIVPMIDIPDSRTSKLS
ncbi:MAG: hypothetical protein QNJ31_09490 [Candidatus Caenarcaniphilales bacterium]|nr:hypothetical protein [Candidatus Caenarcaniphilales bacterium]